MSSKILWELTEFYNFSLNVFLILVGMAFAYFNYGVFYNWRVLLFTLTLLLIFLATNVDNNYKDYMNATDDHFKQKTNIIGREHLNLKLVKNIGIILWGMAFVAGIALVYYTNLYVLFFGLIGCYVAFFYSGGKHPINSMIIAESVPSFLSGFMIPMLSAYTVIFEQCHVTSKFFALGFITFLPMFLSVFNSLLINNISDLKEDIANGRKTLVFYLGQKNGLRLLNCLMSFIFVWVILLAILRIVPYTALIMLIFIPKVIDALKPFNKKPSKKITYPAVLKVIGLIMLSYSVLYTVGLFFK